MLLEDLKNRRVIVWGNGKEGHAVTVYLEKRNCTVKVVEDPVTESLSGIVVKSPGVSIYRREVRMAKQYGTIFTSGTNLFMEACLLMPDERPFLIGVTGTKGKSTTASLIAHMLREQGNRVALCGNIGFPAISYADNLDAYDCIVVEMSSYQCADLKYGFDVSVVLNLYPEHIDWHQTHENYYNDKLNILRVRSPDQVAILNANNGALIFNTKEEKNTVLFGNLDGIHVENGWFYDGYNKLFSAQLLPLRGEHNLSNICAALTAVKEAGGDLMRCEAALRSFEPLPHRIQEIAMKKGVRYVDDSISTTPESAMAAIKTYPNTNIVLIAGGFDREQDYNELADFCVKNEVKVIAMHQTGERLADALISRGGFVRISNEMDAAVKYASTLVKPGDVVLLSPAAPSYGVYTNFEERGNIFKKCVEALED